MRYLKEFGRGYLYFTRVASCYILITCSCLALLLCLVAGAAYYAYGALAGW